MPLKSFVTKLEEVPDAFRGEYKKTDDGFVLDVDGSDYQQRLGEFRGNNITLMKEREELEKQLALYKDIDPEKYADMVKKQGELDDKNLIDSGKFDELLEKRVSTMRADFDGKSDQLTKNLEKETQQSALYKEKLDKLAINDTISKAVGDIGKLQVGARDDVLARAHKIWTVNEKGIPIAMNGDTVIYGKDGKLPITAEEWAHNLRQENPYLFEGNSGGGAGGSGNNGAGGHKTITSEEAASGKYIQDVAEGKVVISD